MMEKAMGRLTLSNDKTEVDVDRLAEAFAISRDELENSIRLGTITYWFELGASDYDTPRMIFHSADTGARVTLDRVGNVVSGTIEAAKSPLSITAPVVDDSDSPDRARLEALLDGALQGTFPASDPIALGFAAPAQTDKAGGSPGHPSAAIASNAIPRSHHSVR
jgi:hypothetical protein